MNLEIPVGKRSKKYRFFEMLPALCSYGTLVLFVLLSLFAPLFAAILLLLIIITFLVKAVGLAFRTIQGRKRIDRAQEVDWAHRLAQLNDPVGSYKNSPAIGADPSFGATEHHENLRLMAASPDTFPRPSAIYNAVIVAAYNEPYEVIDPTIQSIVDSTYDNQHLIIVLAYEERGGAEMKKTAERLQKKYSAEFFAFHLSPHPANIPHEVIGKGGNITYAGRMLKEWLPQVGIEYTQVIVTTLDCDNKPHAAYFDYVTYEYIVHDDRKHLSFQPVSLFFNNIWDAPAPMRVVATGNSFWNIVSATRPHTLRNFASHAQPMDALVEMDFWSVRTIVEDGHQYWRSYFYFDGNYRVAPIYVPIYQDAVMSSTYLKTLKAQFIQLRRWAYGASDVPYVGVRVFSRKRTVPLASGVTKFVRLLDSHITLATVAILVAIGGWIPLLFNTEAARLDPVVHQLPDMISVIQRVAMIGLFVTIFLAFKMLPPRPARYKRHRNIFMLLQWLLMPVTSIVYSAASSLYSQGRLFLGKYLEKFDVTEKSTYESVAREKQQRKRTK